MTPSCEASAVSLTNITTNAAAGGRTTFHDCGRVTRASVCKALKFSACAPSSWWRGTDSKPGADDLGQKGRGKQANGNGGDAEQRSARQERLDHEQNDEQDHQKRNAAKYLHIGDDNQAQRQQQDGAGTAQHRDSHAEGKAQRAADNGHAQRAAHCFQDKQQIVRVEERGRLLDYRFEHQRHLRPAGFPPHAGRDRGRVGGNVTAYSGVRRTPVPGRAWRTR